ncbi:MAG: hypothetical protein N3E45_04265 [Oscillatoriaceae bacterium SKW80]|nr:hypothetical protein [Oscillatoriaceae bacterium SKYG93]MCX8120032.1 hypothetical protein [Oscillatoriaceae bacterium SKW80]MDW8454036.1 hypothetical protein [Oscillatoriaceae cyanobacterium SKYGB_i_bin93]
MHANNLGELGEIFTAASCWEEVATTEMQIPSMNKGKLEGIDQIAAE